ncbi:hypothetical protein ACFLUS_02190 [Chloroflexota bacterium]
MDKLNHQERCPKCGGNLYLDKDHYGWYEECLQCGFTLDLRVIYNDEKEAVFTTLEKLNVNIEDD